MTNCVNCGAPLIGKKCAYCGTRGEKEYRLAYMFRGVEIKEPTEEQICDPHLLVTWVEKEEETI
jgi:hypothetical protein